MSTYPASALLTPNEAKRLRGGRSIAVGLVATVAAIIVLILVSGVLSMGAVNNLDYVPTPHTENVISGSMVLNPDGYFFTGFLVPEDGLNHVLKGNFTATGNSTNNSVIVTVWSQKEFINWLSCKNSIPCYNKDLMPMVTGNINVTVTSGQYLIVFSGASVEAKTVLAQIDLTYSK